jgi:SAM-dependent methyltransferase
MGPPGEDPLSSAARVRQQIESGRHDPAGFRDALGSVPPAARDAWLDRVLGLGELPGDGPELPAGCVPYLPCAVDTLLHLVEQAAIGASDVFVDVGSGVGRAAALVHLCTGAAAIGIEIQPGLARLARELAARLGTPHLSCIEGDASQLAGRVAEGSVFLLYCPFSGERLVRLLASLEPMARTRVIRLGCVDLPLPPCPWLAPEPPRSPELTVYRSTLHPRGDR